MAGADRGGLCGGHDRPVRNPRASTADRRQPHAGRKLLLALALACAAPAAAQAPAQTAAPDARTLALAAGWKASFLCSDTFISGLEEATITANELEGAQASLQPHLAGLKSRIDRKAKWVEVSAGPEAPARYAQYVDGRGCVQLPIGGRPGEVPMPPQLIGGPDLKLMDAKPWPQGDRQATAPLPAAQKRALDAIVAEAISGGRFGKDTRTSAVLVIQDGRVVAERYARGIGMHTPHRTFSVAKSLVSAMVGRATLVGVTDPMKPAHVPEWWAPGDPRAGITLDELLRMQSGLWTNGPGNRTDALYYGGSTVAETAATAPVEVPPSTRYNYANNDTLLAVRGLETDLGETAPTFAYTHLLWPLGMTRTTIEGDWLGSPILSSQVWMTARDMARLALLHLNDGVWAGKRLLPEGWVKTATTAVGPQPPAARGMGYGRAIWLMGAEAGLPEGSYGFLGNRGQYAIVVPARKLVVVRRGFDGPGAEFRITALAAEVAAALE